MCHRMDRQIELNKAIWMLAWAMFDNKAGVGAFVVLRFGKRRQWLPGNYFAAQDGDEKRNGHYQGTADEVEP